MAIKVAFIGAGSVGFTRKLVRDILAVPELVDTHFAFTDISKRNLDMVTQLVNKDIKNNKMPAKLTSTQDRRAALADADYVFNVSRIGGLEAFATDIEIPLKYGIDQCVADTLCAGGIMYGQRNIPCILDFCRDMREVSKDKVLFLNYANPNCMNVWAATKYGNVNTVGLCHGVMGGWKQIANVLGAESTDEVDIVCTGINHQTWYTKIIYQGREISGEELLEKFEKHPVYSKTEKCRIDVLRRFGYYSTESNGHLSEYLPWYRKRPNEIKKWISTDTWINGETGGYLRVCTEGRNWFKTDFPQWLKADDDPITPENRGHEHGSYIIESLETGRPYRGFFIVPNEGIISNLADDAMIESVGWVDRTGINMTHIGDLPLACAATLTSSIDVQRMSVEAAVHGDVMLLKQAMLHDPLTGAVCNPPEIWQMTDEMLVAQAKWLPQYTSEIPLAKRRLAKEKPLGTKKWKGAARLKTRSVTEMKKQADEMRALAAASDKAAAKRESQAAAARKKTASPKKKASKKKTSRK